MIEPIQDYFSIEIECRYNESKSKSGIILLNTAWVDDSDMDRNEHKRIYGKVLSVPSHYSENAYRAIDEGMPSYHKFVGHDDIVDRINRGYRNHADKAYYASTFEKYEVVTMADIAKRIDVKVGDKVYFMPQVTEDENMREKAKGREVYQMCVTDLICVVRESKQNGELNWSGELYNSTVIFNDKENGSITISKQEIIMQGENILVKPNMETWDEITTKSGIIMKPNPEAKWLEGIVAHSRHDHIVVGKKIVYLPNADCAITVEDEKYYVMPVQDIIGELT